MQRRDNLKMFIVSGIFIFLCIFVLNQTNTPIAHAQSCTAPAQVTNVAITFPNCTGNNCNFTQGSCSWGTVSGATGYQVTITEVETNRTVQSQQIDPSTTTASFPVSESNTYRCDVVATNSCGNGPTGTASLLCKVDAAVTTSPTATPTVAPAAPTATPVPHMLVTGNNTPLLILGSSAIAITIIGSMLLFI